MATEIWVEKDSKWCDLIGQDVVLAEKRVFPAEMMPDVLGYRVAGCRCTAAVDCNLAGIPCKWAFTNPTLDQFVL